ncbi:MAG TPA: ABC transporter ATP-binding protein [Thermoanaerobaculia bacterium]|jgi:lipopolysaccharide transport system ATP-binding protein
MSRTAIRVQDLGKQYTLGRSRASYRTLRETLMEAVARPFERIRRNRPTAETIWALKNVSFEIPDGQAVGVIGRNGAGKSTLLKVLSRITMPTQGRAEIHGRVGSLLEVGTGFHPELTGRENTYLNGAILGMRNREIDKRFDDIVQFAELEKFVDTPVKHYSSGMYMRLAFAVAAHLETEILLIDEVLAVGDATFQKRCLGKMEEVAAAGRTVLFVSHNMTAVSALCSRAIWIDAGSLGADGAADEVTSRYIQALASGDFQFVNPEHGLAIESVTLRNGAGERTQFFSPGDDLCVEMAFEAKKPLQGVFVRVQIESLAGSCFAANMLLDGQRPERLDGRGVLACRFKALPLLPQTYTVKLAVVGPDGKEPIVRIQEVASFTVNGAAEEYGFSGEFFHRFVAHHTSVVVPYEWILPDGTVKPVFVREGMALPPSADNRALGLGARGEVKR